MRASQQSSSILSLSDHRPENKNLGSSRHTASSDPTVVQKYKMTKILNESDINLHKRKIKTDPS